MKFLLLFSGFFGVLLSFSWGFFNELEDPSMIPQQTPINPISNHETRNKNRLLIEHKAENFAIAGAFVR
jgi:hypothetical protein